MIQTTDKSQENVIFSRPEFLKYFPNLIENKVKMQVDVNQF